MNEPQIDEALQYLYGEYYGYPVCCTRELLANWDKDDGTNDLHRPEQLEVCQNSGFIPCLSCARRIQRQEITLKALITNRQAPYPFLPKWPSVYDCAAETWDEETERRNRLDTHWIETTKMMRETPITKICSPSKSASTAP